MTEGEAIIGSEELTALLERWKATPEGAWGVQKDGRDWVLVGPEPARKRIAFALKDEAFLAAEAHNALTRLIMEILRLQAELVNQECQHLRETLDRYQGQR